MPVIRLPHYMTQRDGLSKALIYLFLFLFIFNVFECKPSNENTK